MERILFIDFSNQNNTCSHSQILFQKRTRGQGDRCQGMCVLWGWVACAPSCILPQSLTPKRSLLDLFTSEKMNLLDTCAVFSIAGM